MCAMRLRARRGCRWVGGSTRELLLEAPGDDNWLPGQDRGRAVENSWRFRLARYRVWVATVRA